MVNSFNEQQMATYILELFKDEKKLRQMSEKAYDTWNKFNPEKVARIWNEVLEKI